VIAKPSPEEVAARLMAPASEYAIWSSAQVKTLIIRAIEEDRGRPDRAEVPLSPHHPA